MNLLRLRRLPHARATCGAQREREGTERVNLSLGTERERESRERQVRKTTINNMHQLLSAAASWGCWRRERLGGRGERTKREGLPAERVRERQLRENARERRKKQLFIECDSGGCGLPHLGADGEPREIGV